MSFVKRKQAIADTLDKFQITALTSRGNCIGDAAMPMLPAAMCYIRKKKKKQTEAQVRRN